MLRGRFVDERDDVARQVIGIDENGPNGVPWTGS